MRNIILFICFLITLACKEKAPEVTPEIQLSTQQIALADSITTAFFHIKSNTKWTASSSAAWCKPSILAGDAGTNRIDLSIEVNGQSQSREATISIASGGVTQQLKVTQAGANILKVSKESFDFTFAGGEASFEVEASGFFTKDVSSSWLSEISSTGGTVKYRVSENPNHLARVGKITVSMAGISKIVTITQTGKALKIADDKNGMPNDAPALAQKIKVGWNMGNSLEAVTDSFHASETLWGNPKASKPLIDLVKKAGFNAIRLPIAWSGYIEDRTTQRVKDEWMLRVREVVDYCIQNDMYIIINIHWDGGWLENNPTYAKQAEVNAKQKALWEQIAVVFRDYDEHLLFAGTNEVHADYNTPKAENLEVQMSYNQTFVDAVRSTGGKNTWRTLVVQSYNTNIELAKEYLVLPKDPTQNRMMVEVHYYDPYDFCLEISPTSKHLWGKDFKGQPGVSNWGQEEWVDATFATMKTKFVDKGVPVVLGEYAVNYRAALPEPVLKEHDKARNYYLYYVTKAAKKNGMLPFYWDNGGTGNNASGLFNRPALSIAYPDAVKAIIDGAN